MDINEIFFSIQGEGALSGIPTIFIRTAGCNLRCTYCDTTYAYDQKTSMTIDEIMNDIQQYTCNELCITGGEPLLQNGILILIQELQKIGYHISIETNGSQNISKIKYRKNVTISMDIKCPSSGMQKQMRISNIDRLNKHDQLKFIIGTREDYDYAKTIIKQYQIPCPIFFQPVWNKDPVILAEWILSDNLRVRLGLQMHKILWGDKKGV